MARAHDSNCRIIGAGLTGLLDVPVRRMLSLVPRPSADRRLENETVMEIPARIPQIRTPRHEAESLSGFKC